MRSAIVAAAFAAGALAVPLMERDIVYETDIVYATAFVTVTAGDAAPTDTPAPAYSSASSKKHWGHGHGKSRSSSTQEAQGYAWTSTWGTTWTESAPAATSAAQDQAPPAYTSVQEQAPAYSSSEEAPAPSSYEAPASSYESTPTSSEAAPSSAPASSASDAKPTDYKTIVEHHHNVHRYNHSAPTMTWNESLAATAEKIGQLCSYEHMMDMDGGGYGQNIAAGVKGDNVSAVITDLFYNGEERAYADADNYGKGSTNSDGSVKADGFNSDDFHVWGHMTQMVWKETTAVGCATVDCSAQGLAKTGGNVAPYFTVCNYYPQGNMIGDYKDNVIKPRGDATCYWNDGL